VEDAKATLRFGFAFLSTFRGSPYLVFLVCSIRTNTVFIAIFLVLVPAFGCFATAFRQNAEGEFRLILTLLKVGRAEFFIVGMLGCHLFAAVDLLVLPVGDLGECSSNHNQLDASCC
jgi:hypothetical protein